VAKASWISSSAVEAGRIGGAAKRCGRVAPLDLLAPPTDHAGMKNNSLVLLFSCAFTLVFAQSVTAQSAAPAFTPERFRAHVAFLADDLLEGRDTGSRGHEIAARYVASQFESFGLKPGGTNGS